MPNTPDAMETSTFVHHALFEELLPPPAVASQYNSSSQPSCSPLAPAPWLASQLLEPFGIDFLDTNATSTPSAAHIPPLSPASALDAALHAAIAAVGGLGTAPAPAPAPAQAQAQAAQTVTDIAPFSGLEAWTGGSAIEATNAVDASPTVASTIPMPEQPGNREQSDIDDCSSTSSDAAASRAMSESEEAKRADRRRRNREASSRSYYRRKAQTEALGKNLRESRAKAASLFKIESALRRENTRLKRLQWERLVATRLDASLEFLHEGRFGGAVGAAGFSGL